MQNLPPASISPAVLIDWPIPADPCPLSTPQFRRLWRLEIEEASERIRGQMPSLACL